MTLFIIRGVSGSGKSYAATTISSMMVSSNADILPIILEADQWFDHYNEGVWEPQHLHQAHKWCQDMTVECLKDKRDVLVCNTFTTEKEIAPYRKIAKDLGVPFVSLIADHDGDNIHNVPIKTLKAQAERFKFHNRYLDTVRLSCF